MKPLGFFLALLLAFVTSSYGDVTIVQNLEGPMGNGPMTLRIKGDKVRVDNTPQLSTIMDTKTGEMLNLMLEQKRFTRVSAERAKAMMETAARFGGAEPPKERPKVAPTGKKENVNGYETEEYAAETPQMKVSYWVATKYPNGAAIIKQLQAATPQMWSGPAQAATPDYNQLPGVPLKTHVKMNALEMTTTVTSIKEDPLPDSLFAVPEGFQEMKLPELGGTGPRKALRPMFEPSASPSAQPTPSPHP